ncbi:MAG TPA: zinc ribbon domain-containing protein [Solirubrobacteraceae bacterium]|nr:zinc ribbon domain-containing protein [Solirubrobacteraceae bacterium]
MDQISGTTPAGASAQAQEPPGFRSRGRARRRARFLRKARELAYRDLGGLVFNLHRFGARNDALVLAKLTTLGRIDAELRALEGALAERRPVTVLREAGITACPRCAAIHSSEDSFCPNCGLSLSRHVDLPANLGSHAGAPIGESAQPPAPGPPPAPTPARPSPPVTTPTPPEAASTPPAAASTSPPARSPNPPARSTTPPTSAPVPPSPSATPDDEATEILRTPGSSP